MKRKKMVLLRNCHPDKLGGASPEEKERGEKYTRLANARQYRQLCVEGADAEDFSSPSEVPPGVRAAVVAAAAATAAPLTATAKKALANPAATALAAVAAAAATTAALTPGGTSDGDEKSSASAPSTHNWRYCLAFASRVYFSPLSFSSGEAPPSLSG
jgi:hypothetical protein